MKENEALIERCFRRPFGQILSLFENTPASWLLDKCASTNDSAKVLSQIVASLLSRREDFACCVETGLFIRFVSQGGVVLPSDSLISQLVQRYPGGCSPDDKSLLYSSVRANMNAGFSLELRHCAESGWPREFWNDCLKIAKCLPAPEVLPREQTTTKSADDLYKILENNISKAVSYIDSLTETVQVDLFKPEKDEVLLGLLARIVRLFCTLCSNSQIATRDIGGIILRCLADTAITFAYLAKKGTEEEFQKFISYSEGKQKLRLLHLQDNYPEEVSIGLNTEGVAERLGNGFNVELLDIDLTNWTKKSVRDLAIQSGEEKVYRLVYDPTSAHLHGSWSSLQETNLVYCIEPLHRFHRLPSNVVVPPSLDVLVAGQEIFMNSMQVAQQYLDYPSCAQLEVLPIVGLEEI